MKHLQFLFGRFQKKSSPTLLITTIILSGLSVASRIVGLVRDRVLTSTFETGDVLDSYFSAFRVPDMIYTILILGTLSSAFIPVFSSIVHKRGKKAQEEANTLASDLFFIVLIIMGALSLFMFFFAPQLTRIVAVSYEGEKFTNTVALTRIMAFSPLIFALSSIFSSILNVHKKFFVAASAPILYNLGIILGAVILYPIYGIQGLGYGVILGALLHATIQIPEVIKTGFRPQFPNFELKALQNMWNLYWPRILVIDLAMVSLFLGTVIASSTSGAVSIMNLAFNVNTIPIGVLAISFATAMFPYLSEAYAKGKKRKFYLYIENTITRILFVLIPAMCMMLVLRAQIVRVIYGAQNFTWEDTYLTLTTLTFFAISIPFQGLLPLFVRIFYAKHDAKTPMKIGLFGTLVNIFLTLFMQYVCVYFEYPVVYGVALAFSISVIAVGVLYAWIIMKEMTSQAIERISEYVGKVMLAGGVTFFFAHGVKTFYGQYLVDTKEGFPIGQAQTLTALIVQIMVVVGLSSGVYAYLSLKLGLISVLKDPSQYLPEEVVDEQVDSM
jgi:putative peptidoglycan lipid II flippase